MSMNSVPAAPSRRRRIVAAAVVVVLLIVLPVWYVFGRTDRTTTISADFEYVNGIYTGSTVSVLGVAVGTVTDIRPQGTSVRVDMSFPDSVRVPADASAYIMSPAIISERFVELGPAHTFGPTMTDGTVIPLERTHAPIDIDGMLGSLSTLVEAMGPDGGDIGEILATGADAWAGRGEVFNAAIRYLGSATAIVGGTTEDFTALVQNLDALVAAMDARQVSLDGLVNDLSALSTVADETDLDLAGPLADLEVVFAQLDSFVTEHRESFGGITRNLQEVGDVLVRNRSGLAEFMDLVPLMMQNLEATVGPDGRSRIRLNVSTALTQFAVAAPLCEQHPIPLCTGAGLTNPISFPISASDPLGIVTAVTGGNP